MQGCAYSFGEAPESARQVATVPAKNPNAPRALKIEEAKTAMLTSKDGILYH